MKYLVLIIQVLQNVTTVFCIKYAFKYYAFNNIIVVFLSEIVKFILSFCIILSTNNATMKKKIMEEGILPYQIAIPSILFFFQNNILFSAISKLPPPVYYVVSQSKIFFTAIFSVLILKTKLNIRKCIALILLTMGICLTVNHRDDYLFDYNIDNKIVLGIFATVSSCLISGLASVLSEKIIKCEKSVTGNETNNETWCIFFFRNMQFSGVSIVLGIILFIIHPPNNKEWHNIFFQTHWSFVIILLHSIGGLVVSFVLKFADNLLKTFAGGIALILSILISIFFDDMQLTLTLFFATCIVVFALVLYSDFYDRKLGDEEAEL